MRVKALGGALSVLLTCCCRLSRLRTGWSPRAARRSGPARGRRSTHAVVALTLAFAGLIAEPTLRVLAQSGPVSADFDEDGKLDTVVAESTPSCQLTVQSGSGTSSVTLPNCVDLLAAGDPNADGHWDVAAAAAGDTSFYVALGDGTGNLGTLDRIDLAGSITVLAGGEINRRDGLVDLAVGITSDAGPQLLIFESPEGAARAVPEEIALGAAATALQFGQFDTDYFPDLAVTSAAGPIVVHGRDRKLFLDPAQRGTIGPPLITSGPPPASSAAPWPATPVATIIVNTTIDSNTRDTVVTLREAILIANGTLLKSALTAAEQAQVNGAPAALQTDAINFDIPAPGVQSIRPSPALPAVTDPIWIDGYTQPGARPNTLEEGTNAVLLIALTNVGGPVPIDGLTINAGSSVVRGLAINGFVGAGRRGILLQTKGSNVVQGNFIGTNAAGTAIVGNNFGIQATNGAVGDLIGGTTPPARNLISGNVTGIRLQGSTAVVGGTLVQGNLLGTDATGALDFGNTGQALAIFTPDNTIGGTSPRARNVISANGNGIEITGAGAVTVTANLVQGNHFGFGLPGDPLPNARGVVLQGVPGNTVGGTTPAARNVISGNVTGSPSTARPAH